MHEFLKFQGFAGLSREGYMPLSFAYPFLNFLYVDCEIVLCAEVLLIPCCNFEKSMPNSKYFERFGRKRTFPELHFSILSFVLCSCLVLAC